MLFRITIFQDVEDATSVKKDKRVGGAAYVKDDPMNSTPKVFHIYPGKQDNGPGTDIPFYEDDLFKYLCVYYGTRVDQTVPALEEEAKKIPEVVPWKHYASLGEEVARLEKENRDLLGAANTSQAKITSLERENEKLIDDAKASKDKIDSLEKENEKLIREAEASKVEIDNLEKEKEKLIREAEASKVEIDRLKALAKAVVDAIEGLKTYDKSGTSTDDKNGRPDTDKDETPTTNDKNGRPDTDKDETPTTDGGKSSAA